MSIKNSKDHIVYGVDYDFADYSITLHSLLNTYNFDLWSFPTGLDEELEESVKNLFEHKFAYKEIGFPTAERFRHELEAMFIEHKTRWNRFYSLYKDVLMNDPLVDNKIKTSNNLILNINQIIDGKVDSETNQSTTGQTSGTVSNDSSVKRRFNDTPESQITSLDDGYLSGLQDENAESSSESSGQDSSTNIIDVTSKDDRETNTQTDSETIIETSGFSKQEIELLTNYKNQYLDIVSMIVNELSVLFMMIY